MEETDLTKHWMRCVKAANQTIVSCLDKVCKEGYIYFCMERQSISCNTSSFVGNLESAPSQTAWGKEIFY